MPRRARIIAAKVAALIKKQGATPTVRISAPPAAGPKIRAAWIKTLLRPTALTTRSAPTISITKLWRVGLSTELTAPRAKTSANTIHGSTVPEAVSPQSASAGSAIAVWVTASSLRFGQRSARTPPQAPKTRIGKNCSAEVTPTAIPLPVSSRISHISATICIQLPLSETIWPAK